MWDRLPRLAGSLQPPAYLAWPIRSRACSAFPSPPGTESTGTTSCPSARGAEGPAFRNISEAVLNEELSTSYGLFTGKADKIAKLRFTPERARWDAGETWHPQQKAAFDAERYSLLEVPYRDDRELVMDILRYGADVEVVSPEALREETIRRLKAALEQYSPPSLSPSDSPEGHTPARRLE